MNYFILIALLYSTSTQAQIPMESPETADSLVCNSISPKELESYERIIKKFGGNNSETEALQRNEEGLQVYLDNTGIRNFSANEIMTPNQELAAIKCGLDNLIPPKCIWPNGGALMSIFERIRELIGGPIIFRNWYRPKCYNTLIEGAQHSDHLLAKSFDIDFMSPDNRAVAQKFICNNLWKKNENVQIGIGCRTLHIGLASPRGKRFWKYGSMKYCPVKSIDNCWK